MRSKVKLTGCEYREHFYNWGGVDWYTLFYDPRYTIASTVWTRDGLNIIHGADSSGSGTYTDKFLYPLVLKPKMVLDGTIFGNRRYAIKIYHNSAVDPYYMRLDKIEIQLKALNYDTTERNLTDLVTVNTNWEVSDTSSTSAAFPFFMSINNEKITTNERLLLETKIYCSWVIGMNDDVYIARRTHKNTEDVMINIPLI